MRVLEAADTLGGGTRSSELTLPGLMHDECSAAHPLAVDSPFSRRFDLGGTRADAGAGRRSSTPIRSTAARGAAAYRSVEQTAAGLGRDGGRWRALFGPVAERFDDITEDFLRPMLHVPVAPGEAGPLRRSPACPRRCWRARFSTPEARALLAGVAAHAFRPFAAPMSSAIGVALGHRRAPLRLAGRRGRVGVDQPRDDLAARGARRALRDRCRVTSLDELGVARHRHARRRARGRGADRRRPDAPPRRARATRFRHGPGRVQGGLRGRREACRGRTSRRAAPGTVHVGGSARGDRRRGAGGPPRADARPAVRAPLPAVRRGPARSDGDVHPSTPTRTSPPVDRRRDRADRGADRALRARLPRPDPRAPRAHVAQMEAHNANYVGGDIVTGANDPLAADLPAATRARPVRAPASPASTCARRPRRRVPAPTGCAATTPPRCPRCGGWPDSAPRRRP